MKKFKEWFFSENASFALAMTGFAIIIITAISFLYSFGISEVDSNRFDHFGSFIGGLVGATWSLASFILLYISLQKQEEALKDQKQDLVLTRNALHLQIKEFELQRTELEGTKIALEEQSKTQEQQRVETIFFQLLGNYTNIINVFSSYNLKTNETVIGKKAVKWLYYQYFTTEEKPEEWSINQGRGDLFIPYIAFFDFTESIFTLILNSKISNQKYYLKLFYTLLTAEEKMFIEFYSNVVEDYKKIYDEVKNIYEPLNPSPFVIMHQDKYRDI